MPEFRNDLVGQHREIHLGLDKMDQYVQMCRTGEKELQLTHLKVLMDSFGCREYAKILDIARDG
jgi:hypothetical protein